MMKINRSRGAFDDRTRRSEQLLQLALGLVKDNPADAAALAERSLTDGISFNFQTVLVLLKQQNDNLANRLFDAAVASAASNPNTQIAELQILQSYLFQPGAVFANGANGNRILAVVAGQDPNAKPNVDPTRARQFLTVAYQILLAQQSSDESEAGKSTQDFILLANTLAPYFKTYAPELAPPLAARTAQLTAKLTKQKQPPSDSDQSTESTKKLSAAEVYQNYLAQLEAKADAETDPIAKKLAYAEAALKTNNEDYERGKKIAGKIEEELLREQVLAFILYRASLTMLQKGDVEKAISLARETPQSLNRTVALLSISQFLIQAKPLPKEEKWQSDLRRQRALELLFEADKSLARNEVTPDAAKVALGRIAVLGQLDKSQALAALGEAVSLINKLDDFDATDSSAPRFGLNGFGISGGASVPRVLGGYGFPAAISLLIKTDFQGTINSINNLRSPHVRGVSLLETAKSFLRQNPAEN